MSCFLCMSMTGIANMVPTPCLMQRKGTYLQQNGMGSIRRRCSSRAHLTWWSGSAAARTAWRGWRCPRGCPA